MVGLSEKQHLAEAPWQRRTVGVPWQRRLAEVLGGGCPHGTHHGTQRWMSPGRGNGGCPYGRGDGANGGCPLAEATVGVPWQRRRRSTVDVPWQTHTWQRRPGRGERWVSPGRGAWQRCSAVRVPMAPTMAPNGGCPLAEATVGVPMAEATAPTVGVPWQRRLAFDGGCPHGRPFENAAAFSTGGENPGSIAQL